MYNFPPFYKTLLERQFAVVGSVWAKVFTSTEMALLPAGTMRENGSPRFIPIEFSVCEPHEADLVDVIFGYKFTCNMSMGESVSYIYWQAFQEDKQYAELRYDGNYNGSHAAKDFLQGLTTMMHNLIQDRLLQRGIELKDAGF